MAKPNYKFDKRQRDIAKKKQQDEKLLRKRAKNAPKTDDDAAATAPADAIPGAATTSADAQQS
jgi:hypothetical protein